MEPKPTTPPKMPPIASGLLTNFSSSWVMRSRTPYWLSMLRKKSELMKSVIQRGASSTIWVTCWTMVGISVAKNAATARAKVETATTMPAARGNFFASSQRTTGSRPSAMKSAATIQRSSWVVLEPIQ